LTALVLFSVTLASCQGKGATTSPGRNSIYDYLWLQNGEHSNGQLSTAMPRVQADGSANGGAYPPLGDLVLGQDFSDLDENDDALQRLRQSDED
jgi:hypothetical protein